MAKIADFSHYVYAFCTIGISELVCTRTKPSNSNGIGVGRVSFSALGSGFGFFDFARVGFRVLNIFSGHLRVKLGSNFLVNFG